MWLKSDSKKPFNGTVNGAGSLVPLTIAAREESVAYKEVARRSIRRCQLQLGMYLRDLKAAREALDFCNECKGCLRRERIARYRVQRSNAQLKKYERILTQACERVAAAVANAKVIKEYSRARIRQLRKSQVT